jgi:hypothetical protein
LVAELLELVDESAGLFRGVDSVPEVVRAEVLVVDVGAEQVPDGDEKAVSDRDQRAFLAEAGGQAPIAGLQVGVLGAGGRSSRLAESPKVKSAPSDKFNKADSSVMTTLTFH